MNDTKFAGRWIALALLAQLVAGPVINFGILASVFQSPPGFIVGAAAHSQELALAVLLLLAMGAVSASIAIAAWPVLRVRSERMALWLMVVGAACLALAAIEGAALMSILSLSQAYTAAAGAGADSALYESLRGVVAAGRNWAHYTHLICEGGLVFVLYTSLFRFRLVPRALAGFGMAAALTQMTAVSMPLFGQPIVFAMLAPLGVAHLVLLTWLLLRGLRENGAARID